MELIEIVLTIFSVYLLKYLTIPPLILQVPLSILILLVTFLIIAGLRLSVKLWLWYDQILGYFNISLRVADLIAWVIVLWFFIKQYQQNYLGIEKNLARYDLMISDSFIYVLPVYFNLYSWGGLIAIGCIIIGLLRLLRKKNVFD